MRRLLQFALVLGLFAIPMAAPAKEKDCTFATAEASTIARIQSNYTAWKRHCVRLSGIAFEGRLFVDREATLESLEGYGERLQRSIVIYPGSIWREHGPLAVEIVGTIGSCKTANDAVQAEAQRTGDIIMTGGYCHTSLATYISPVAVRVLSRAPILRLIEAEVPEADRPLVEPPAETSGRDDHVAAARAMVAAIATRDEAAFRRLRHPDIQDELDKLDRGTQPAWLREDIREAHKMFLRQAEAGSAFASLLPLASRPEKVLIERSELAYATETKTTPSGYLVCWCWRAYCAGRCPLNNVDSDNDPARPFL